MRTLFSHPVGVAPLGLSGERENLRTGEGGAQVERAGGSGVVLPRRDGRVAFVAGADRVGKAPA